MAMMDWENYGRVRYEHPEEGFRYGNQNGYEDYVYGNTARKVNRFSDETVVRKQKRRPRMEKKSRVSAEQRRERRYVSGEPYGYARESAVPERRREERPERRRQEREIKERKPVKLPGISGRGFLFLGTMLTSVVVLGFSYLSQKNTVAQQKSQIVSLQSEIAEMKEQNDELHQNILNSVNLADIYKTATEKLKMVHAGKDQIFTYSNKKSNMVKQYANIPGAD